MSLLEIPDVQNPHALTAQTLGIVAWCMGLVAASQESDARLKSIYAAMCAVMAVHFWMLGAYTGAVTVIVTGIRNVVSIRAKWPRLAFIFVAAYIIVGIYKYQTPVDLFATSASILSTFSLFYLSGIRMRAALTVTFSLWLIHNIIVGSIGGILLESGNILLVVWRAWKMHHQSKTPAPTSSQTP